MDPNATVKYLKQQQFDFHLQKSNKARGSYQMKKTEPDPGGVLEKSLNTRKGLPVCSFVCLSVCLFFGYS